MKAKVFQTLIRVSMVYLLLLIAVFLPAPSFAEVGHNLIIQIEGQYPVELEPGDVINLSGGPFTHTGVTTIWGHSAMYLGMVDGEKKFLDFTTTKKNHSDKNDLYRGRILNAKKFLTANLSHKEFNVFRLATTNTQTITKVNQPILVKEARRVAEGGTWTLRNTCSRVVANVLSAATKPSIQIDVSSPDGFDSATGFYQPAAGRVNINDALKHISLVTPEQIAIQPVQQPAVLNVSIPFESLFPRLKGFAMTACRSTEQVALEKNLYQQSLPISFNRGLDDPIEQYLSTGMGDCERQLFHKLIEMIRVGQGRQIDAEWVREMVRGYQPVQPVEIDTPPPVNRGRECFIDANGIRACTVD